MERYNGKKKVDSALQQNHIVSLTSTESSNGLSHDRIKSKCLILASKVLWDLTLSYFSKSLFGYCGRLNSDAQNLPTSQTLEPVSVTLYNNSHNKKRLCKCDQMKDLKHYAGKTIILWVNYFPKALYARSRLVRESLFEPVLEIGGLLWISLDIMTALWVGRKYTFS